MGPNYPTQASLEWGTGAGCIPTLRKTRNMGHLATWGAGLDGPGLSVGAGRKKRKQYGL